MSVVVLLSGGLDSVVLATMARRAGKLAVAVFVDYGQPAAEQERLAAQRWAGKTRTNLVEISTRIPGTEELEDKTGPCVVPCRNLILVSLAASVAVEWGAVEVWYGATAADQADYIDCRPSYAEAMSVALSGFGVSVHVPLTGMRRGDICVLAKALEVDVKDTWSCYEPKADGQPCGVCSSCRQ